MMTAVTAVLPVKRVESRSRNSQAQGGRVALMESLSGAEDSYTVASASRGPLRSSAREQTRDDKCIVVQLTRFWISALTGRHWCQC